MRGIQAAFLGFVSMTSAAFGQDKATIDKLNESFMAAFQKGDSAAIGQMYAEDAYLLPSPVRLPERPRCGTAQLPVRALQADDRRSLT